jgi:methylene-fatty-acyl-phospholipid synthase
MFRAWCARPALAWIGEPVHALQWLFIGFKGLQIAVFLVWCGVHGHGTLLPAAAAPGPLAIGTLLIACGLVLNAGVFYRLGTVGVFYGNRLGHYVPWSHEFPFSHFNHPQYLGALLSIWGFFVVMRFPEADWFALPLLETVYYAVGMRLER